MGYAQAEDHAVEVARRFVTARGEGAKYLGTDAESDFRMKRYGNYEVAKRALLRTEPAVSKHDECLRGGLQSLCRETSRGAARLDSALRRRRRAGARAGRGYEIRFRRSDGPRRSDEIPGRREARERFNLPFKQAGEENVEDMQDLTCGSNMWALAGSRTTSGKTILMGNPHQAWAAIYWEGHVTVPGKINFYGATFVGRPVLTTGFNEHLGWSHTVNYPDLADVYALTLAPDSRDHYMFDGRRMPLTKKEIAVEIKQPDGQVAPGAADLSLLSPRADHPRDRR